MNSFVNKTSDNRLAGKSFIVTGAGAGLGAAICRRLNESGARTYGIDIKWGSDVRDPAIWDAYKGWDIDGLINCAGINANDWFEDVSPFQLQNVMEVNAFSMVYAVQGLLPQLHKSSGVVVNIVSNAASMPMTSSLAYNMSKAAALMATKQMAHELTKKYGITVFSVSPNKLKGTEMSKQIEADVQRVRGWTPEFAADYQAKSLMHGLETPPEMVAEVIVNALETGAWKYMSGTDIPVGK
jgi:NAD(P)-dependent dehydrogenase (short-subunit alcohol dehydrogenase family)